ncbi:NAD(P)H-dependent oxidoreductase [Burkholderia pyrrocinia]|uniref:NAD(P)H-dependent oxidoreductase n=1 Tax=Burkholderia pyrrocinia TaxID=60550 RepID=UPI0010480535|nr:NAD(P)H-dependent oxidoreductase [Burkholderia pyrrocinia]TDA46833.1 hypothetical protein EVG18_14025 [Burkholderia pyrrocinia]UOB59905.1 NAD(P)H-dependent oxidoreductase [Burkholderia pyrrocinia]
MTLLHADSSIIGDQSVSRLLTASIVASHKKVNPSIEIACHDLAAEPLDHLDGPEFAVVRDSEPIAGPTVSHSQQVHDYFDH